MNVAYSEFVMNTLFHAQLIGALWLIVWHGVTSSKSPTRRR